jgi:hypothetical protein
MALFKPVATAADLPAVGESRESGTYDFKRTVDPAKKRELAKDVAAFANATGGVVLVGADEDRDTGKLREYAPLPEALAESIKAAYDVAITEFCRPQPVIDAVRVKAPPPASGYVVAVNVNATPLGPVGVRSADDPKCPSWAFPLRTTTHTAYLTPTELAMLMVPEIRRVAILLDSIPQDQREKVYLLHVTDSPYGAAIGVTLREVDPDLTTFLVELTDKGSIGGTITLPVDCVRSVWRRDSTHWNVFMSGSFSKRNGALLFVPL